jgi:hypothetical protein
VKFEDVVKLAVDITTLKMERQVRKLRREHGYTLREARLEAVAAHLANHEHTEHVID